MKASGADTQQEENLNGERQGEMVAFLRPPAGRAFLCPGNCPPGREANPKWTQEVGLSSGGEQTGSVSEWQMEADRKWV